MKRSGLKLSAVGILVAMVAVVGCITPRHALAADAVVQVLDQLDVFNVNRLKRSTTAPIVLNDLNSTGATTLRSCQDSARGITCLDVQIARQWKVPKVLPATPSTDDGRKLFSCQDDALALASGGCTSLTVDVGGDIWLAGQKTNSSYNLYEVKRNRNTNGTCPTDGGATGIAFTGKIKNQAIADTDSAQFCAYARRTAQPALLDISAFDGQLASRWPGGRGILAVANKNSVLYFPSNGDPVITIGAGKTDWSLSGNEAVLSVALLQQEVTNPSPPSTVYTYAVATTDSGRVLWRRFGQTVPAKLLAYVNAVGAETADPSIDPTTGVVSFPQGNLCETGTTANNFEVRASDTTGRLFLTNRNYCKLFVSSPVYSGADIMTSTNNQKYSTTTTFKPDGVSVSPGIAVDLTKCANTTGCGFLPNGDPSVNTYDAANLASVTLVPNTPTGLTVFQIRNIPDCRFIPTAPECDRNGDSQVDAGLIVTGPRGDYLNVTPLLPQQIKDLFDASGLAPKGLPPLYISPRYRAQSSEGYRFEALFGITDPNTTFRSAFTMTLDIGDPNLAGAKLGCGAFSQPTPQAFYLWDIVTYVSERFSEIGGPTDTVTGSNPDHVDVLGNTGCFNPTPIQGTRFSLYSYNLELNTTAADQATDGVVYLGEFLKELSLDVRSAQSRLACANVDFIGDTGTQPTSSPLNATTCSTLDASWVNMNDKLNKCINATYNPKSSALDQNCTALNQQFNSYYSQVQALVPTGTDPANRAGELLARLGVIHHVFYDQFLKAAAARAP